MVISNYNKTNVTYLYKEKKPIDITINKINFIYPTFFKKEPKTVFAKRAVKIWYKD